MFTFVFGPPAKHPSWAPWRESGGWSFRRKHTVGSLHKLLSELELQISHFPTTTTVAQMTQRLPRGTETARLRQQSLG